MKFLSSFTFLITIAFIAGILIGKIPYGNEIAKISLIIAMIISVSNIPFRLKSFDKKKVSIAVAINYIFLTSLILIFSIPFYNTPFFTGFIVMAAAPPAIAVLPLTKIAKGNAKLSLFSLIICYILSIFIMPFLIYIFLSKMVNPFNLIQNIFFLIVIPILTSRFIKVDRYANEITNILFFFVIFPIIGMNRDFLFTESNILLTLSLIMFARTIVSGGIVKKIAEKKFGEEDAISYSMFASFKNEGLVMIFSASLFQDVSAVPAIIATIFELLWVGMVENGII